jgi:formate dehydrogenase major subunit
MAQRCTVPEGTSIMRAAMEMGTQIPKLCATDMVNAFGSCRMCLVEVEGRAGTPASCTTPAMEGLVVHTQTDRLKQLRKGVMELYISDHPLDCLTCAANGDCELQDMAGAVGLRDVRYGYEGENHVFAKGGATRTGCRRTSPIRTSPTIPRSASSARVACALVRRCRALSR